MFVYRARPLSAHDGDTLTALIDVGFGARVEEAIRLAGVSAPELSQTGGPESRAFTAVWLAELSPALRWPMTVHTVPTTATEPTERRTFVRYVATVIDAHDPSRVLNIALAEYLEQHPEWGSGT